MKNNKLSVLVLVLLVVLGASSRILNAEMHLPNYAPIIAFSLFAGAIAKNNKLYMFAVPVLSLLLADVYFGLFTNIPAFYGFAGMVTNYGALCVAALLGSKMKMTAGGTLVSTLSAAVAFFIISNFGFYLQGWNGYSFGALIKTYADGLPFFKYTLEGNLVCAAVLFAGYSAASKVMVRKVA